MNPYQQQRLRRSEALILLHCQLMRRPRPHSMWGHLCQQIRAVKRLAGTWRESLAHG